MYDSEYQVDLIPQLSWCSMMILGSVGLWLPRVSGPLSFLGVLLGRLLGLVLQTVFPKVSTYCNAMFTGGKLVESAWFDKSPDSPIRRFVA